MMKKSKILWWSEVGIAIVLAIVIMYFFLNSGKADIANANTLDKINYAFLGLVVETACIGMVRSFVHALKNSFGVISFLVSLLGGMFLYLIIVQLITIIPVLIIDGVYGLSDASQSDLTKFFAGWSCFTAVVGHVFCYIKYKKDLLSD